MIQIIHHLLQRLVPPDLISFLLVGASGAIIYYAISTALQFLVDANVYYFAALSAATIWNFLLNHYLTFNRSLRFNIDLVVKFVLYSIVVSVGIFLNISAAALPMRQLSESGLLASFLGVFIEIIWRFAMAKTVIWPNRS